MFKSLLNSKQNKGQKKTRKRAVLMLLAFCLLAGCIFAAVNGRKPLHNVAAAVKDGDVLYGIDSSRREFLIFAADINGKDGKIIRMPALEGRKNRIAEGIALTPDGKCQITYIEYESVDDMKRMTADCNFERGVAENIQEAQEQTLFAAEGIYKEGYGPDGALWYVDNDGSIWREEKGAGAEPVFENNGAFIGMKNTAYCLGKNGIYFFNEDDDKVYRIPYDIAALNENICPEETGLEKEWGIEKYGKIFSLDEMEDGSFTAVFSQEDGRLLPAVLGESRQAVGEIFLSLSWHIRMTAFVFLSLGAVLIGLYLLYFGVLRIFGQVFPSALKAFCLALPVMAAGCFLLNIQVGNILTNEIEEQEKSRMYNDTHMLSHLIRQEEIFHGEPEVYGRFINLLNGFFDRTMYSDSVYNSAGRAMEKIPPEESNYDLFLENKGEFYLVGPDFLSCMPSENAYGKEISFYLKACRDKKYPIIFQYNDPQEGNCLVIYTPVTDSHGDVRGIIRGQAGEHYIQDVIKDRRQEIMGWIWMFFTLMLAVLMISGALGLAPLLSLRRKAEHMEYEKLSRMKKRGKGEVAQVINFFARMSDSISLHLKQVRKLKEMYEPFIPNSVLEIFGKKDIREIAPGEQILTEAAFLVLESDEMEKNLKISEEEEFAIRNKIYCIVNGRAEEEQGVIEHFTKFGASVIFRNGIQPALNAAVKALGDLSEKGYGYFFGAGLMVGQVRFGIIGTEDRMEVMSVSPSVEAVRKLNDISCKYHTGILMTENTKERLDISGAEEDMRLLTWVKLYKEKEEPVYEYYESLEKDQRRLRKETKADFEEGLCCLKNREYKKARDFFAAVLRQNPKDMAAEKYFFVCDRIMEGAEEPKEYLIITHN